MASTLANGDVEPRQRVHSRRASPFEHAVLTVLVADPEADAYQDLDRFCIETGATLVVSRDGADALFQAGRCFPDVVLLSACLPVVAAGDVVTVIRRHSDVHIAVGISAGEADRAAA